MVYQKRLKKERRARKRLQEQLDLEIKRRTQLEEALKATGASSEQVRAITGTCKSSSVRASFHTSKFISSRSKNIIYLRSLYLRAERERNLKRSVLALKTLCSASCRRKKKKTSRFSSRRSDARDADYRCKWTGFLRISRARRQSLR